MKFRHNNSLVRHLFQHSGERPYHCRSCNSSFTQLNRLKEHVKRHHDGTNVDSQLSVGPNLPESHQADKLHLKDSAHQSCNGNDQHTNTKSRSLNSGISHYKPIAPAPVRNSYDVTSTKDVMGSQIIPSANTTILLPAGIQTSFPPQANSYLTQGTNGTYYLMNNTLPAVNTQPSSYIMPNSNGIVQFIQQPPIQGAFVFGNPQNISNYIQTPVFSPLFPQQTQFLSINSIHNQPSSIIIPNYYSMPNRKIVENTKIQKTNRAGTPEPSDTICNSSTQLITSNGISMSKSNTNVTSCSPGTNSASRSPSKTATQMNEPPITSDCTSLSIHNFKSSEMLSSKLDEEKNTCNNMDQKITFQTGSFKDDTVTYQNNTGQTVKLDILERAILTIPGLSES